MEQLLNAKFVQISIDECIKESACPEQNSCTNKLNIRDSPAVVFTNQTSFVGVNAIIEAICDCLAEPPIQPEFDNCGSMGGVTLTGNGWALYPSFEACNNSEIRLELNPQRINGLVFYIGPFSTYPEPLARGDLFNLSYFWDYKSHPNFTPIKKNAYYG